MQCFYLYYGTTFCLKLETLVIIRFLFFYPIKIDILVTFERKTTEHGLGNALDFGVIENIPEKRDQAIGEIPGFPTTDITTPNIRFQQKKQTHIEMTRPDSMPVKYHKDDSAEKYKPVVDEKMGREKHWNLRKLLTSHESAHVIFTLFTQATVGAFLMLIIGPAIGLPGFSLLQEHAIHMSLVATIFVLSTIGLFKLNMHLGKPHRFYRGFNNLRLSPVSREIAGVSMFYTGLLGYAFFALFDIPMLNLIADIFAYLAVVSGPIGLYFMYKLYRIPARPFWNHLQTGTAFLGSMLSFGGLIIAAVSLIFLPLSTQAGLIQTLAVIITAGLIIESIGHIIHARDMQAIENEGAASYYHQTTQYGKSYLFRNGLLAFSLIAAGSIIYRGLSGVSGLVLAGLLALAMIVMAAFGRSLFFVLVIPTTMPGAFFWKNDGFVNHARETGLAEAPQVGVVYQRHHAFKVDELMQTIKENSIKDMLAHVLWIFGKK